MGGSSLEDEQQGAHGMTGAEWRVATALFTAGEVVPLLCQVMLCQIMLCQVKLYAALLYP